MNYPVAIHKDSASDYGVTVPDLPGCFSAGKTFDEALANVREAIELHLEGLIEEGEVVPQPAPAEDHIRNSDFKGAVWGLVSINPSTLRLKAVRINITIPERTLGIIDSYAAEHGHTRSGLLTEAAMSYIGRNAPDPIGKSQSGGRRVAGHRKKI